MKTFDVTTFDNVNHFKVLLKDVDGKDVVIDLAREEKIKYMIKTQTSNQKKLAFLLTKSKGHQV